MDKRFEEILLVIGTLAIIFLWQAAVGFFLTAFALGMLCVIDHTTKALAERQ